jgi:hypothetical protein
MRILLNLKSLNHPSEVNYIVLNFLFNKIIKIIKFKFIIIL